MSLLPDPIYACIAMTTHSNRYIFIKDNVKILRYTCLSVTMKLKNRGNDIEIQVGSRVSASAYSTNVSKVKILAQN